MKLWTKAQLVCLFIIAVAYRPSSSHDLLVRRRRLPGDLNRRDGTAKNRWGRDLHGPLLDLRPSSLASSTPLPRKHLPPSSTLDVRSLSSTSAPSSSTSYNLKREEFGAVKSDRRIDVFNEEAKSTKAAAILNTGYKSSPYYSPIKGPCLEKYADSEANNYIHGSPVPCRSIRKHFHPSTVWDFLSLPSSAAPSSTTSSNPKSEEIGAGVVDSEDENAKSTDEAAAILNVSSKDSPYALIDRFFPEREADYEAQRIAYAASVSSGARPHDRTLRGIDPSEVWLSEGGLLVLKGGSPDDDQGDWLLSGAAPWPPLDDYQAPYREPLLPPPDFIPEDTGVGVPLPPEDEIEEILSNDIRELPPRKTTTTTTSQPVVETTLAPTPDPVPDHDLAKKNRNYMIIKTAKEILDGNRKGHQGHQGSPHLIATTTTTPRPVVVSTLPVRPMSVLKPPPRPQVAPPRVDEAVKGAEGEDGSGGDFFVGTSTPNSYSFAFRTGYHSRGGLTGQNDQRQQQPDTTTVRNDEVGERSLSGWNRHDPTYPHHHHRHFQQPQSYPGSGKASRRFRTKGLKKLKRKARIGTRRPEIVPHRLDPVGRPLFLQAAPVGFGDRTLAGKLDESDGGTGNAFEYKGAPILAVGQPDGRRGQPRHHHQQVANDLSHPVSQPTPTFGDDGPGGPPADRGPNTAQFAYATRFENRDPNTFVVTLQKQRGAIRRDGHGYASFFCNDQDCSKSWGYSFRS